MTKDQMLALKPFFLLTNKPVMAVVNVGEDDLDEIPALTERVSNELDGAEVLGMCIQLEAEAALMDLEERTELARRSRVWARAPCHGLLARPITCLGLRTYFTTGEKESRAWTFPAGAKAPQCAGVIHTDFERGFIRAETIQWDLLIEHGGWAKAREFGDVRSEGKDYEVADGDTMDFRFNV